MSRRPEAAAGIHTPSEITRRLQVPAALAPVLIVVFLVSLAIVPIVIQLRIRTLRTELSEVADPARALVTELQLRLAMEGVGARGFMLTRESSYATIYYVAQRERSRAYAELVPLTQQLGEPIAAEAKALGGIFDQADSLLIGVMSGGMPIERYLDQLPARQNAFTEAAATVARIDRAIGALTVERRQAIRETERAGVLLSIVLVLLALAAALAMTRLMAERRRAVRERERLLEAERSARAASQAAQREAERKTEELERVTESRAGLMRGFSHDVKNPLGAADGYMELLEEGVIGPITSKQQECIGRARRSLAAALRLIRDLLELARAETIAIERDAVDLRALVRDLVDEIRAVASARNLDLSADLSTEIGMVHTDAVRVRQIVGNLLSNAIKFTPHGSITARVAIDEGERRGGDGSRVVIEVTDTGPGIPEDQKRLLFREFHRLNPAAADGEGIGLAISRRLALALGGDLTVESRVGRGSTFALWLPAE